MHRRSNCNDSETRGCLHHSRTTKTYTDKPSRRVQVLRKVDAEEAAATIDPWADELPPERLLAEEPAAGSVAAERALESLGARELQLSNGMRVVFRPSDLQDDQILLMVCTLGNPGAVCVDVVAVVC